MKTIEINGTNIEIRRIKVKEVKELLREVASKVKEIFKFIDNISNENDLQEKILGFIIENIDYVGDLTVRFTKDFTKESFEDLDVIDLVELLKEILAYNGIKGDFIKLFFQNYKGIVGTQINQDQFIKAVPQV